MGKTLCEQTLHNFNSHAHVERDSMTAVTQHSLLNFNSHAHVERDVLPLLKINYFVISTHTLTWSVTTPVLIILQTFAFQLTRSRGA